MILATANRMKNGPEFQAALDAMPEGSDGVLTLSVNDQASPSPHPPPSAISCRWCVAAGSLACPMR